MLKQTKNVFSGQFENYDMRLQNVILGFIICDSRIHYSQVHIKE